MTVEELIAAADERAALAAQSIAAATGGASLCSVSRSGRQIPGVKYPEGRWAALREVRRRLRPLSDDPDLVRGALAEIRATWRADMVAKEKQGQENWVTYRLGGVDALDEIAELFGR